MSSTVFWFYALVFCFYCAPVVFLSLVSFDCSAVWGLYLSSRWLSELGCLGCWPFVLSGVGGSGQILSSGCMMFSLVVHSWILVFVLCNVFVNWRFGRKMRVVFCLCVGSSLPKSSWSLLWFAGTWADWEVLWSGCPACGCHFGRLVRPFRSLFFFLLPLLKFYAALFFHFMFIYFFSVLLFNLFPFYSVFVSCMIMFVFSET